MTGSRRSTRQTTLDSSNANDQKRKASGDAQQPSKRGKKGKQRDPSGERACEKDEPKEAINEPENDDDGAQTAVRVQERSKHDVGGTIENGQKSESEPKDKNGTMSTSEDTKPNGFDTIMNAKEETKHEPAAEGTGSKVRAEDDAVEESSERDKAMPHSILEKGIIYFFFRGRVGQDEPNGVTDVARSYIVLRPLPHGAKLGEGPIGDAGRNRILALPKKVLPISPKDRFLCFVELAGGSMDEVKERFAASDYATKTAGARHTPAAAPIGEGVYAITQTGRDTHLAYKLTIPEHVSDVQTDMGLQNQGSYLTSAKNPESSAPANAQLPQTANYPSEIQEEFHGRGWMPLQPKLLDYEFTQFLLIGHKEHALEKAAKPQDEEDQKSDKETPLEEIEQLQQEDEKRVQGLHRSHAVFADLGLSHQEYPKLQTTW